VPSSIDQNRGQVKCRAFLLTPVIVIGWRYELYEL
jgi:hypothetical protein